MSAFKCENVLQVYSGKPGCMCGCLGSYRCTAASEAAVNIVSGYASAKVNEKQVKKVVDLFNSLRGDQIEELCHQYAYAEVNGRAYAIYFLTDPHVQAKIKKEIAA